MNTSLLLTLTAITSLLLASCGTEAVDQIATTNTETSISAGGLAQETLREVNRYRTRNGLPQLQSHSGLQKLAQEHSQAMYRRDKMEHFGFSKRAKYSQKKFGMRAVSENLHRSWAIVPSASSIANQWANSPKHRDNMTGNYTHAGLAITQVGDNIFTTLLLGEKIEAESSSSGRQPLLNF